MLHGEVVDWVRELMRQTWQMREVEIVRGAISADRVHLLASAPSHFASAKLVQNVKWRSSRRLQQEYPHMHKRFRGRYLWARGYLFGTLGVPNGRTVREYVESQKWDEDVEGFKITAPESP